MQADKNLCPTVSMTSMSMATERPFRYTGGELCCEGVTLAEVVDRYGTPAYVYSAQAIREAYLALDGEFSGVPHCICYSIKANPNLSICALLAGLGAGADVTSGGELYRALKVGFPPEKVVFAGVGKSAEELEMALQAGIGLFSVESEGELRVLSELAERVGTQAPIALRVNPDVDPHTHPYITTGLSRNKFGIPIGEARPLYALAATLSGVRVEGVGMHIGSQMMDLSPMAGAAMQLGELARGLKRDGHPLRYFDIGGGYAISYDGSTPDDPSTVASRLVDTVNDLGLTLLTEPGRFLLGRAGALLLRVLYRKRNGHREFIIADAGMNALLRPALYDARHELVAVREDTRLVEADVVGPVCESSDFLSVDTPVPDAQPGELLAVLDAGAYGSAMASEYNGRPRPAEVLVGGATATLIRRRQSYEEMLAPERLGAEAGWTHKA